MHKVIDIFGEDKELIFSFFVIFSRFEYALKCAGFVRDVGRGAEVDWEAYEKSITGKFSAIKNSFKGLTNDPPRKQILGKTGLEWGIIKKNETKSYESYLLLLVKAVRNNLFHGGKYPFVNIDEPSRNIELLKGSIEVINSCLRVSPNVKTLFEQ